MTRSTERYVAVIFTSRHTGADVDEYGLRADRMEALAAQQPGYRGVDSARGEDGLGITVSYWDTAEDAAAWKQHAEHLLAQHEGRDRWYAGYHVRIATVEREYTYDRGDVSPGEDTGNRTGGTTRPTMNEPDEILHIALPEDWAAARAAGEYRVSTRGRSLDDEGFVHCSYVRQLEGVANRVYADVAELVLLHLDHELLDAEVRVEPAVEGGDERFPHVYGPIPTAAVIATTLWDRDDDGIWRRPQIM